MSDTTFDPKSIFDSYRSAFSPAVKAQQEGVKALDRVGRYQYEVAGDYLEWGLAQAKAALVAQTPADFVSKQVELTAALSEKLRARAQEFVALATEAQTGFVETTKESSAKVAAEANKFASGTAQAASQATSAGAQSNPAAPQFKQAATQTKQAVAQTKKTTTRHSAAKAKAKATRHR